MLFRNIAHREDGANFLPVSFLTFSVPHSGAKKGNFGQVMNVHSFGKVHKIIRRCDRNKIIQ